MKFVSYLLVSTSKYLLEDYSILRQVLYNLLSDTIIDYVQSPSKWCQTTKIEPNLHYIQNIRQAKDACSNDYDCAMIADIASLGEKFSFCDAESKVRHSLTSSSLYTKCKYYNLVLGLLSKFFHLDKCLPN